MSFFGAVEPAPGEFAFGSQPERFPDNWVNREEPYTILEIAGEILAQYLAFPVLFGGNVGPDNFDALGSFGIIANGQLGGNGTTVSTNDVACLLFQVVATEAVPDCKFPLYPTVFGLLIDDLVQLYQDYSPSPSSCLTG